MQGPEDVFEGGGDFYKFCRPTPAVMGMNNSSKPDLSSVFNDQQFVSSVLREKPFEKSFEKFSRRFNNRPISPFLGNNP